MQGDWSYCDQPWTTEESVSVPWGRNNSEDPGTKTKSMSIYTDPIMSHQHKSITTGWGVLLSKSLTSHMLWDSRHNKNNIDKLSKYSQSTRTISQWDKTGHGDFLRHLFNTVICALLTSSVKTHSLENYTQTHCIPESKATHDNWWGPTRCTLTVGYTVSGKLLNKMWLQARLAYQKMFHLGQWWRMALKHW